MGTALITNGRGGKAALIVSYDVDDVIVVWGRYYPESDAFAVDSCEGVLLRKITKN